MFKKWLTSPGVRFGVTIVLLLTLVLAFPNTRALADKFLTLFRVQKIAILSLDATGLQQ